MTFSELYAALYGRRAASRKRIRTATQQVIALKGDMRAAWIEYRDRRLEARHAR